MLYELLQCNHVVCEIKEHVNCISKLHDDIISAKRDGVVAEIKGRTLAQYHYAIRKLKK